MPALTILVSPPRSRLMDLAELQKYIGPLITLVTGLGGIVTIFFWWHKKVVARLEAEKDKAVAEKLEAVRAKSDAETKTDQARAARDAAVEEKDEILKKARELRGRYDTAVKQLKDVTEHRDRLVGELASSSATAQQKLSDLQRAWEKFAAAKKDEIERLLGEKATVMLDTQQLESEFAWEKQQLEEKLEAAKAKLAAERKQIRETLKQQGKIWLAKVPKDAPHFRSLSKRKAVIIAVLNLKGGVGKTTITANLAGLLGSQGKRVLMIDLDHQRSLSRMLLKLAEQSNLVLQRRSVQTFFTSGVKGGPQLISNAISVSGMPNCELIVNHEHTDESDHETVNELGLEELEMQLQLSWLLEPEKVGDIRFYLREGLHSESVSNSFDFVFLDCPPRMSTACVNALVSADFVLVPVQGESVAKQSLMHLARRLKAMRDNGPCPSLRVLGVLGNLLHPTSEMESSPEVVRLRDDVKTLSLLGLWPDPVSTFETVIPRMKQFLEASSELGDGGELKLAIQRFPAVRTLFEQLILEIEGRIDDCRNSQ